MSTARLASRAQLGLHAPLVHVECHVGSGLPTFTIVGLPATGVRESKDRVRAALATCGLEFPAGRITVNLAPAEFPKQGGRFDLPIALGVLLASGQMQASAEALAPYEFYGELGLSGEVKPVKGLLLAAAHAARSDAALVVPEANVSDVTVIPNPRGVYGAKNLLQVCEHLKGAAPIAQTTTDTTVRALAPATDLDLRDVRGQLQGKRALCIAAAGGHSLLMVGPPGSGKSMLAMRLSGLLPALTDEEALEVAMIASASGAGFNSRTYGRRPLRAPHHTSSINAIVGGGPSARPGEISLAHRGVLFLDELPEFDRRALETLREPMETGIVCVSRVAVQAEYPAEFQLIAAMNPCPCGYHGDASRCECTPGRVAQYRGRVSGPLLDRIDLRINVPALTAHELIQEIPCGESTAQAAARVNAARELQLRRSRCLNARMPIADLARWCRLDAESEQLFWDTQARLGISARAYHHMLRVGRTIADLAGSETIRAPHVAEALQLRRALEITDFR